MSVTLPHRTVDDFCKRSNCSYDALASKLDVSRATIFNWKKDSRGLSRIVLLALIALDEKLEPICVETKLASHRIESDGETTGASLHLEIKDFCKRNNYSYDLLSAELKVSRATVFNWKNTARGLPPRIALLALTALEKMPELRTVKKPSAEHASRKQYRRGTVVNLKE
jgi:transcriptional regulator with XRE-family HTH domain